MIAYVRLPNRAMTRSWPTGSGRRAFGARDSGTYRRVSRRAARPTGRLTQKMERQPTDSTSRPPIRGPAAMEMPTTPPHTPIARARSRGSVKVLVMIDMATGLSIEPPTACTMRATTSHSRSGAREQSREPNENTTRPARKTFLRPIRSAVDPASISRDARTRVYASIVHWRPEVAGVQVAFHGGEGDVEDGVVEAHDQQAHAADREDEQTASLAQLWHAVMLRRCR